MYKAGQYLHEQQLVDTPWGFLLAGGSTHCNSRGIRSRTASELLYQSNINLKLTRMIKANEYTVLELGRPESVAHAITYLLPLPHLMMVFLLCK